MSLIKCQICTKDLKEELAYTLKRKLVCHVCNSSSLKGKVFDPKKKTWRGKRKPLPPDYYANRARRWRYAHPEEYHLRNLKQYQKRKKAKLLTLKMV